MIRFKPQPLAIPEADPFKEDLLGRKESAENLTAFVESLAEPFVLAIDSPWGTGKTTFLRMWRQHLENQGFPCLYFNAWENDFTDSPLVSLIGELGEGVAQLRLDEEQGRAAQKAFETTKRAGAALLKAALPTALKLAISGLLDLSAATEADLGKLAEDMAKKQIEKYQADKKTITSFRDELQKLVKTLAEKQGAANSKPVVLIIDELDRCRPPYAIELLEKVKHLFSVEGLVFVLAIDREQLGESVRSLYGAKLDADGYLRRFIDLEYRLPEPDSEKFATAQFERFGLNPALDGKVGDTRYDSDTIRHALPKLFVLFGFSLRTQEQCFSQLGVILRTTPANSFLYSSLLAVLICLRADNKKLYLRYCSGHASHEEVMAYLRQLPGGNDVADSGLGISIEAHLAKGIVNEQVRESAMSSYFALAKSEATDPKLRDRAKLVSQQFSFVGAFVANMTRYLHKKIEMAHRFVPAGTK